MENPRQVRVPLVIASAAVLVALTVYVRLPIINMARPPFSDFKYYHDMAAALAAEGARAVWGQGQWASPASWWPPLWPVWLAGVYRLGGNAQIANLFLASAATILLLLIGWRFHPLVGIAASTLWAVATQPRVYAGTLASEHLAIVLMLLALWLALCRRWYAAVGAAGLLALTREAGLPVVGVLLLAGWLCGRSQRRLIVMVTIAVLLIAPWCVNRSIVLGGPVGLSNYSGMNIYMGTHWANRTGHWCTEVGEELRTARLDAIPHNGHYLRKAARNLLLHPANYWSTVGLRVQTWLGFQGVDCPVLQYSGPPRRSERQQRPLWAIFALLGTAFALWRRNANALRVAACYWGLVLPMLAFCLGTRYLLLALPLALLLGTAMLWEVARCGWIRRGRERPRRSV